MLESNDKIGLLDDMEDSQDLLAEAKAVHDWKSYMSDEAEDVEGETFLLKYQGVNVFPLGDLQAVKAHAKQGKTFAGSVLMSAVLGDETLGWECKVQDAKVLFVDTEQAKYNTINVQRRIHKMLGENERTHNPNFVTLRFRGREPEIVLENIENAIREFQPQFVWLDGIRDLLYDFNDLTEGSKVVLKLMSIAEEMNCAIACVLHTNKGDDNMRGHLGSELVNKVSDVFKLEKNKDKDSGKVYFKMEQTEARNQDIPDFEFEISPDVLPILRQMTPKEENDLKQLIRDCMPGNKAMSYGEIVDAIMEQRKDFKSQSSAKRMIRKATQAGFLWKEPFGKYIFVNKPTGTETKPFEAPKDSEAPF